MTRRSIVSLALVLWLPIPASAIPSQSLDPSFGQDGRAIADFGVYARPSAVALGADGTIVIAGGAGRFDDQQRDFAVARFLPDGTLDDSFSRDGRTTSDVTGNNDVAAAVLIQPNGEIVAAGVGDALPDLERPSDFAVVRYTAAGRLDHGFGADGMVTTDFGDTRDAVRALALQPDGKILAAGYSFDDLGDGPLLSGIARYNPDGSLDTSFGTAGLVRSDGGEVLALRVQPDGGILAAGGSCCSSSGSEIFSLARYDADGTLDTTFGAGGIVRTDVGAFNFFGKMAFTPGGEILAPGFLPIRSSWAFAVARFTAGGLADMTFGGDGQVRTDFRSDTSYAFAVRSQADGRVVAVGVSFSAEAAVFALARYEADGSRDPSFGRGGITRTRFGRLEAKAEAVIVDGAGRIVAAGIAGGTFAVTRYRA